MKTLLVALPGNEAMAGRLAGHLGCETASLETRVFPDGESYVRYVTSVEGKVVVLIATLDRPNEKFLPVYFAAKTARELGAVKVGLVAPYLAYLRQDKRFHEGEAVTSRLFADVLSQCVDWLVTVDPHLHRLASLSEVYGVPVKMAHSADRISEWITANVVAPLLIGPDEESEQWVGDISVRIRAPHLVLRKTRQGDRDVIVSLPDMTPWQRHTPVLMDDIISTGRTMANVVTQLRVSGFSSPVCIAIHGVFAGTAYTELMTAGADRIITTNTVSHSTNTLDVSPNLALAVSDLLY